MYVERRYWKLELAETVVKLVYTYTLLKGLSFNQATKNKIHLSALTLFLKLCFLAKTFDANPQGLKTPTESLN